ncbi:D-xylulose kinase-like protein [Sporormia fimetaria CBS 119925]|uniref:Xylulose kinase n=1 Tax=Sporormia fimetaria CBS 119925 TaxID=1340428 RepID=A0A6A6VPS6_9PLEO|nr:D-xylulose kinase-like protein [Sporormia fimetaria CBS 119925]
MADHYLGFDLSTQQLKGIIVKSDLKLVHEAKVDFDADFAKYGIHKGVLTNPEEHEVFAPVAMFLEAIDLVLQRLKEQGADFSKVKGISGAGMQHGTVFWSKDAETLLGNLNGEKTLLEQLGDGKQKGAFSHAFSPNWQDASTQKQCEAFDKTMGDGQKLAAATGSSAHHRFSGPQILKFHERHPSAYKATSRISLVSSFVASIFLGKVAPMDISDVCGANLWDIENNRWHEDLLALAAGEDGLEDLRAKLGDVPADGGASFGSISKYFVERYNFPSDAQVIPFTGDNPATMLALPLHESDAIVSLGTSTTFLMSTHHYKPDPSYHFMNHPTTPGLYMFMLCYKNGGLAREHIRDALNTSSFPSTSPKSWDLFNQTALSSPILGQSTETSPMRLGLFFPRPEIVPNVRAGIYRFLYNPSSESLTPVPEQGNADWNIPDTDARAILESQFLSLRLRSAPLVAKDTDTDAKETEPPAQPRRIYLVGGGAVNPAIVDLAGQVLGGTEGVYKLDIGGNACALGAAYKAAWGVERRGKEGFERFLEERWDESAFVKRVGDGYRRGVFERYGVAVEGLRKVEERVVREFGHVGEGEMVLGDVIS